MNFVNEGMNNVFNIATSAVEGVTNLLPVPQDQKRELDIGPIERPFVAIVDYRRVSNEYAKIESILDKCDTLILNGEMIFAFYEAQGLSVGSSPVDEEDVNLAKSILDMDKSKGGKILLPKDVVVVDKLTYYGKNKVVAASEIPDGWTGVDIGPESVDMFNNALDSAKTVIWEPERTYDFGKFSRASEAISQKLSELEDKEVKVVIAMPMQMETRSSEKIDPTFYDESRASRMAEVGSFHFGG